MGLPMTTLNRIRRSSAPTVPEVPRIARQKLVEQEQTRDRARRCLQGSSCRCFAYGTTKAVVATPSRSQRCAGSLSRRSQTGTTAPWRVAGLIGLISDGRGA